MASTCSVRTRRTRAHLECSFEPTRGRSMTPRVLSHNRKKNRVADTNEDRRGRTNSDWWWMLAVGEDGAEEVNVCNVWMWMRVSTASGTKTNKSLHWRDLCIYWNVIAQKTNKKQPVYFFVTYLTWKIVDRGCYLFREQQIGYQCCGKVTGNFSNDLFCPISCHFVATRCCESAQNECSDSLQTYRAIMTVSVNEYFTQVTSCGVPVMSCDRLLLNSGWKNSRGGITISPNTVNYIAFLCFLVRDTSLRTQDGTVLLHIVHKGRLNAHCLKDQCDWKHLWVD